MAAGRKVARVWSSGVVGVSSRFIAGSQSSAAGELPAAVGPVEDQVEDPEAGVVAGAPAATRPRAASTRQTSRSRERGRSTAPRRRRPSSAGTAPRLPPRPGLHPVRDHLAHLPEPASPQELLGVLPPSAALAHLHGVVVPPHRLLLRSCPAAVRPAVGAPVEAGVEVTLHQGGDRTSVRTTSRYTPPPTTRQEPIRAVRGGLPRSVARHARYVAAMSEHPSIARFRTELEAPRRAAAGSSSSPTRCTPRRWPPRRSAARSARSPTACSSTPTARPC